MCGGGVQSNPCELTLDPPLKGAILNHIGIYSFTGLDPDNVDHLKKALSDVEDQLKEQKYVYLLYTYN